MVRYTQDGSQFNTVLYSERERVSIHTGIQTLREKANREARYKRGAILHCISKYFHPFYTLFSLSFQALMTEWYT